MRGLFPASRSLVACVAFFAGPAHFTGKSNATPGVGSGLKV